MKNQQVEVSYSDPHCTDNLKFSYSNGSIIQMSGIHIPILISHKNISLLPSSDSVGAAVGAGAGIGAGAGGLTTICFPCFFVFFSCSSNS